MSEWYEAKDENIDLDFEKSEVNIFVKQNYHGSVYTTLTFDQFTAFHKKIKIKEGEPVIEEILTLDQIENIHKKTGLKGKKMFRIIMPPCSGNFVIFKGETYDISIVSSDKLK